jgi:hypothetical protein
MSVSELVVAKWGPPDRRARFTQGAVSIEVYKFEAATTGEGVVIYVTVTSGPSPSGHWGEFMLGLDVAHDEVAAPLASLSAYARATPLHHGDTVPIGDPPWPGSGFSRFLVMRQVDSVLGPFRVGDRSVEYLTVIPVYESEVEVKAKVGADALIDRFRSQGVAFWKADRGPLAT